MKKGMGKEERGESEGGRDWQSYRCLCLFPHLRTEGLTRCLSVSAAHWLSIIHHAIGSIEVHPSHLLGHLEGREDSSGQVVGIQPVSAEGWVGVLSAAGGGAGKGRLSQYTMAPHLASAQD